MSRHAAAARSLRAARPAPLLAALAALALAGCGGSSHPAARKDGCLVVGRPSAAKRTEPAPTAALPAAKRYTVTFETSCGAFSLQLDQAASPHAVASFVSLVQHGFFDRTIFHRIVPGFVIQGGDPTQSGGGGPGYTTIDPPPANAAYTHGVVAMAKTAAQPPGTAGSQFFVVTEANAGLGPDYAIIGKVSGGLAVVDHIGTLGDPSSPNGTPTMTVEIERATVAVSG